MEQQQAATTTDPNSNTGDPSAPGVTPKEGEAGDGPDSTDNKIDPITALQDGIDGLSLAMFEALRGLRDAVAPESGNLGNNNNNNNNNNADGTPQQQQQQQQQQQPGSNPAGGPSEPDMEDLWQAYRQGDPSATALVQATVTKAKLSMPQKRDEFVRVHAQMEMEKDKELVLRLARTVLDKSQWIDNHLDTGVPGMHRTRTEQMERIQELVQENAKAIRELDKAYVLARQKRDECRAFVKKHACQALGIGLDEGGKGKKL